MGIFCTTAEQARQEIKAGVRLLAVGADISLMTNSAKLLLEAVRES